MAKANRGEIWQIDLGMIQKNSSEPLAGASVTAIMSQRLDQLFCRAGRPVGLVE
jgi:hypothetical protein